VNSLSFIWNDNTQEKREANVIAYKGTETDVLYGVEIAWRADATAHVRRHFLTTK
jgi:hypothetical protein